MKDIIKECQLLCAEWIQENNLQEEYNKYWMLDRSNHDYIPFTLLGFALHYELTHSDDFVGGDE